MPSVRHIEACFTSKDQLYQCCGDSSWNHRASLSIVVLKLCCTLESSGVPRFPADILLGWDETWTSGFWKASSGIPMCIKVWESVFKRSAFSTALSLECPAVGSWWGGGLCNQGPWVLHNYPHPKPSYSQCPVFSWLSLASGSLLPPPNYGLRLGKLVPGDQIWLVNLFYFAWTVFLKNLS